MNWKRGLLLLSGVVVIGGCATIPAGPSVMVMPGPGKSFEAFQLDDNACRQWAGQQIGVSPDEAANKTRAGGAVLGTLAGAAVGAAVGAAYGNAGAGAAIGAGSGLLVGTAGGSAQADATRWELQRRYDIAYQQCMFAKGNRPPGYVERPARVYPPPPPPPGYTQGPPISPPPNPYPQPPR